MHKALDRQIYITTKEKRLKRFMRNPFKPAYRRLFEFIARKFKILLPLKVKTFWNDRIKIILPERSSSYILKFGFWEEDVSMMLIENLKPGTVFFDVGAHLGYFSLLASSIVGDTGQVHSFEPSNWAVAILKDNLKNRSNCTINQLAAFSEQKTLELNDYGPLDSLYNSFFTIDDSEPINKQLKHEKYNVKTIALDDYASSKNIIPDLVKIDAETAEYDILKGMQRIINLMKTIFIFEIGGFSREKRSSNKAVLFLLEKGYTPYEFKDGLITKYELKDETHYKNLLFLP